MKYGFVIPGGSPRECTELAAEAEQAGWDGVFISEVVWGFDAWVILAGMAMVTQRVKLGTMLTPVSRRRPWKLASELLTLDHLSNGRALLSAGLGAIDTGFANFGEATDRKLRAELLDEGLAIITGLWRGQPFNFQGKHYQVQETTFFPPPPPIQQPRIPIWVVGAWPRTRSMQRVARYDGWLTSKMEASGFSVDVTAEEIKAAKAFIDEHRIEASPFDIIKEGETPGDEPQKAAAIVHTYAEMGYTWWIESKWDYADGMPGVRKRIQQGPPRIA
ncbi:MAG: LLM class flavin-dependent oxidoreductase [Chloroflexi bacterium]|nr:LLM class flavin-dependent oxidoreductase [Chloroflexota bacterium]